MDLLVIRHAKATDKGGIADPHRPLTTRGRKDALHVGKALAREKVEIATIIASPLVRAVETAELVAVGLDWDGALEIAPELSPNHAPDSVIAEVLTPRFSHGCVAVVGHEPQLGGLLRALLHGYAPGPRKASATLLTWDEPDAAAKFRWVIHPELDKPSKDIDDIG